MGVYDYTGNAITSSSHIGIINPIRYRGYFYDEETGFYYLQSRYYDSEIGRFINADSYTSTGQGLLGTNMYAYCGNDPIKNCDPTGCYFSTSGEYVPDTMPQDELGWAVATGALSYEDLDADNDGQVEENELAAARSASSSSSGNSAKSTGKGLWKNLCQAASSIRNGIGGMARSIGSWISSWGIWNVFSSKNSITNTLPSDPSILSHIFRNKSGHVLDTAENRQMLINLTNNPQNYLGGDQYGNSWYAKTLTNGQQQWAVTRNGIIWDGGVNDTPKEYNSVTGLKGG